MPPAALRGETLKSFNKLSHGKNKYLNLSFQYLIESFNPFFLKNGLGAWGMKSPTHLVGHRPSSVGIAIGHANYRRVLGTSPDLSIWI